MFKQILFILVAGDDFIMDENKFKDKLKKLKEKVMLIVTQNHMCSIMNNTKWRELQNAIDDLPFPPPYELKYITDKVEPIPFNKDVTYWGDWTDEPLTPFFRIEWVKVRPRYLKYKGRLIKHELIDETEEFVSILQKYSIPYDEEDGTYIIYGYNISKI